MARVAILCLTALLAGTGPLLAQHLAPQRVAAGDELAALIADNGRLYLEAKARRGEDLAAFARRLCRSEACAPTIERLNGTSELRAGSFYRVAIADLELSYQLRLLGALFPRDRITPQGWEHRVTYHGETLWRIASWLTGAGSHHRRLQEENALGGAELGAGQVFVGQRVRVPAELLLPRLGDAVPREVGAEALSADAGGKDALTHTRPGETLFAAVARLTGRERPAEILDAAAELAARAGLADLDRVPEGLEVRIPVDWLRPERRAALRPPAPPAPPAADERPAAAAAETAPSEDRLLVGVLLGGQEAGSLEVIRREEAFALPLEPLADLAGASVEETDAGRRFVTPIGSVELLTGDLEVIEGVTYLRQSALEEKLATPTTFDREQFALVLDLPWSTGLPVPPETPELEPDVGAPGASLSTLRTNFAFTADRKSQSASSTSTLGGRLAGGWWRLRYDEDFAGASEVREVFWLRTLGNRRFLVGQQRANVHPLLGGLELTGVQVAHTNQPLELFSETPELGELLSRHVQPQTSLRGSGPPAGLAELRIDGEVVSQQLIGLDGVYEFFDIALESRRLSRIEVLLYDRHNLAVPVAIHEKTLSASDLVLAEGAVIHLAGAGRAGNLLQDPDAPSAPVGFYQWRHGLTEKLTLEAAFQEGSAGRQAVAGLVSRLGLATVASLALGASEDGLGYDLAVESQRGAWRMLGRSRWLEAGYRAAGSDESFAHDLELGYRRLGLDLALIGRSSRDASGRGQFLLPAIAWRPLRPLALRARPDRFGDYRFDLDARFGGSTRLGLSYQDSLSMDLSTRFGGAVYLTVASQLSDGEPERHSAILRWYSGGAWRPAWTFGTVYTGGRLGYLAGVNADVRSGIRARLEVSDPTGRGDDLRVALGLTTDLAFARGRLLSGRRGAVRDDRGGIAGRVRTAGLDLEGYNYRDLKIFLDGRLATRTESGGGFFIGALEPGIYRLELDAENLPIELNPVDPERIVEVAAAAVTRVTFEVIPEFGFAGRLTDAEGEAGAEVWIELLDAEGREVQTALTDRFGLYRFDRLAVGRYTVRVSARSFPDAAFELPSRAVEIRDDFLFGQDLTLP